MWSWTKKDMPCPDLRKCWGQYLLRKPRMPLLRFVTFRSVSNGSCAVLVCVSMRSEHKGVG
jgi:hypothetical protein